MAEATKRVQVESRFIEDELFRPLWSRYGAFAELNPATTLLLTAFAFLSVLPILIFLAFAILALSTVTFLALGGISFVSFWVVGSALGVLLVFLTAAGFTSSFISIVSFNLYVFYRLIAHLTGPEGVTGGFSNWFAETRARLGVPTQLPAHIHGGGELKGKVVP